MWKKCNLRTRHCLLQKQKACFLNFFSTERWNNTKYWLFPLASSCKKLYYFSIYSLMLLVSMSWFENIWFTIRLIKLRGQYMLIFLGGIKCNSNSEFRKLLSKTITEFGVFFLLIFSKIQKLQCHLKWINFIPQLTVLRTICM